MSQRAFTPNTTYGDTYRKPGKERKEDMRFMNTDKGKQSFIGGHFKNLVLN